MSKTSKALTIAVCTLLMSAACGASAFATETKWIGMFPTDTLDQWGLGASVAYEYKYQDTETALIPISGVSATLKERNQFNSLRADIQAGLGYGLQVGADFGFEMAGRNKGSVTNGYTFVSTSTSEQSTSMCGFYNPTFSLRWDMVKALSEKPSAGALVLEYTYKPARWGSKHVSANYVNAAQLLDQHGEYGFDTHTAKAIGSLTFGASRAYLGYVGSFSGAYKGYFDNTYPVGYPTGNIHSIVIGSERAFTPKFSMGADFKYSMVRARGGFGDGYGTFEGGLNASFKVAENLRLVPYFKSEVIGTRTYQDTGFIASTPTNYNIATGVALKAVF
ncbi:hypothetical protein FY034_17380 (plasmid) [Trichlorobacter lovleyi]|uniref:hypothetical protein n=1 Tax=Trichlorobacter lovleyi TaxID=313985 RepID=UPI00223FE218|nr:hypothetical protein [Trichlorobacter lovleyi]QOX80796.1 hypothetical protein FY034_17380 [Trichlorobacter lovleyi]